jgi:hypothetical protein
MHVRSLRHINTMDPPLPPTPTPHSPPCETGQVPYTVVGAAPITGPSASGPTGPSVWAGLQPVLGRVRRITIHGAYFGVPWDQDGVVRGVVVKPTDEHGVVVNPEVAGYVGGCMGLLWGRGKLSIPTQQVPPRPAATLWICWCCTASRCVGGWVDGWMGGWVDGWMGGWVDVWMVFAGLRAPVSRA